MPRADDRQLPLRPLAPLMPILADLRHLPAIPRASAAVWCVAVAAAQRRGYWVIPLSLAAHRDREHALSNPEATLPDTARHAAMFR
jgi:hypothetical protein